MRKVAFVTGTCGGIGRACAVKLAKEGWDIVVAGHTLRTNDVVDNTIFDRARELSQYGTKVLPVRCDLEDQDSIDSAVIEVLEKFGRVDALVNAAAALWWDSLEQTSLRRFDLLLNVNVRGAFALTARFLPNMRQQGNGHIVFVSPPIDLSVVPGHIAQAVSKFGMTMINMGLSEELKDTPVSATSIWPKSRIGCYAPVEFMVAQPDICRSPEIMADAIYEILQRPDETFGQTLIDEDYLESVGYTHLERYTCEAPECDKAIE